MLPWVLLNATLVGLLVWQSARDYLEKQTLYETLDHLLEAHRHIALTQKAENATEAQVAIERDLEAHKVGHFRPMGIPGGDPTLPESHPANNQIQVGGRRFSIYGLDPDHEREFLDNVISEVTNATPVKP